MKLPEATDGSAWYVGRFESPAFKLWGSSAVLAEKLFAVLKPHGALPQDFKIEGSAGNATLVYELLRANSNLVVRVRLDALEITFHSINAIGAEAAIRIGMGCWQAIKDIDGAVELTQHELTISAQFIVDPEQYQKIIGSFLNAPKGLPSGTLPGVAFYMPPGQYHGDRGGSIVLDRIVVDPHLYLNVRTGMMIDAKAVPVTSISEYIDTYVLGTYKMLDLQIEE